MKRATVEGKLAASVPFCHVLNGMSKYVERVFIGVVAEERNIVGKHGHLHVFGFDLPKVIDVQQEEEPRHKDP